MFACDSTCCDCCYMDENPKSNGKFKCTNSRKSGYDEVSANMRVCPAASEAWTSRRSSAERRELSNISRKHGYYVLTAISKILGLAEDNIYMDYFMYARDYIMPNNSDYSVLLEEYENVGPEIASALENDPKNEEYCEYLRETYLERFYELGKARYDMEAILKYFEMIAIMKKHYGITSEQKVSLM